MPKGARLSITKMREKANKKANRMATKKGPDFSSMTEMVTFVVGKDDEEKEFGVHKEFACHYCPVFRAAFNSQFIEGQTQTYRLEDTTPDVFRLVVKWLYTQKLDIPDTKDPTVDGDVDKDIEGGSGPLFVNADFLEPDEEDEEDEDKDEEDEDFESVDSEEQSEVEEEYLDDDPNSDEATDNETIHEGTGDTKEHKLIGEPIYCKKQMLILAQLWILADKLRIPRLQNQTIDVLHHYIVRIKTFAIFIVDYVYQNTAAGYPLRRLLIRLGACQDHHSEYRAEYLYRYPPEYLLDVVGEMKKMSEKYLLDKMPKSLQDFYVDADDE